MDPEKISVENDKSTSKLVIKNLQLYDSGEYVLRADNNVHRQEISVFLHVEGNQIINSMYCYVTNGFNKIKHFVLFR